MVKILWICLTFLLLKVLCEEECGALIKENDPTWNVGIYHKLRNNNLELVCLGTAVKRNVIVTAAHCICDESGSIRNEEFYVSWKKLNKHTKLIGNLQKIEPRNVFVHSSYKGSAKIGDIAILTLQNYLKNEDFIPICIDWDNSRPILEDGEKLRHPTWQNGNVRMTDVSYLDYDHCFYIASDFFKTLLVDDKICAKSDNGIIGGMDDGAGLIYFSFVDNLWYLRGVVSAHDPGKSNVISYTNIILYLNWLSSISSRL